jgi:glutathione S-transferase
LFYPAVKSRNYHIQAVAQAGGINLTLVSNGDAKKQVLEIAELPFGKVPYLVDGNVKIAQSNAIFRYISRKGNQQGDNDAAFAASEELTEDANQLFDLFLDAYRRHGSIGQSAALANLFTAPESGLYVHVVH